MASVIKATYMIASLIAKKKNIKKNQSHLLMMMSVMNGKRCVKYMTDKMCPG